jgi:hypothetical protein
MARPAHEEVRRNRPLDEITTRRLTLGDAERFLLAYAGPIRAYLVALLGDSQLADEVSQEFLARLLQRGLLNSLPNRGRFRHYLKSAVRNAALTHLRSRRGQRFEPRDLTTLADERSSDAMTVWITSWRSCLLEGAWRSLAHYQSFHLGNFSYDCLRLTLEFPDESSTQLALRASNLSGRVMTATTFRQHVHRARVRFAMALVHEVGRTLAAPSHTAVREELMDLKLWDIVHHYLPKQWRADSPSERV